MAPSALPIGSVPVPLTRVKGPGLGGRYFRPRSFHIFSQMFNIRSVLFNISGRWSNILFDRKAGLSKIVPERFNIDKKLSNIA
ncbi:hypothetical protein B4135_2689 [Caldibacillus debilis]|uniref:Uncharacterized protein n=1 Tax=Caldibacillus debilis TaxID=301148 RepID=A0A150LSC5_9BACI|nr:hypothetical protein B4135_2689 [Caldibacillus debilis]